MGKKQRSISTAKEITDIERFKRIKKLRDRIREDHSHHCSRRIAESRLQGAPSYTLSGIISFYLLDDYIITPLPAFRGTCESWKRGIQEYPSGH